MDKLLSLKILKPGIQTLILNGSNIGMQKYGVPIGGPMDLQSAKIANWLVGNDENSAIMEIAIKGPKIEFNTPCQLAFTGATTSPTVNSKPVKYNQTIDIRKDDILNVGTLEKGCRAYLAVRGKWKPTEQVNNFKNHILKGGDLIDIEVPDGAIKIRASKQMIHHENTLIVRAIKGPEFNDINHEAQRMLEATAFTLLPESNRMGYRLQPSFPNVKTSIISSGVVPGVLQVTPNGLPILLMQDAPTTGGYLRVLTVVKEDMDRLGQLRPGDKLAFSWL